MLRHQASQGAIEQLKKAGLMRSAAQALLRYSALLSQQASRTSAAAQVGGRPDQQRGACGSASRLDEQASGALTVTLNYCLSTCVCSRQCKQQHA